MNRRVVIFKDWEAEAAVAKLNNFCDVNKLLPIQIEVSSKPGMYTIFAIVEVEPAEVVIKVCEK